MMRRLNHRRGRRPTRPSDLSIAVDVGSMLDAHDADGVSVGDDAVDDAVGASSSRVIAGELAQQWSTDAFRFLAQRTDHELDDRSGKTLGQSSE